MIGMDFVSFLILLVISIVVSGILHYWLEYYVTPGFWSFCSKVVVGWVGAWLGSRCSATGFPGSTTNRSIIFRRLWARSPCWY
jgi:hypothetical protein